MKQPKKPPQPKDPFNGAGHFKPRKPRKAAARSANPPKSRKAKPLFLVAAPELVAALKDIRDAATASIARLNVLDVTTARNDFEWIRDVADQQLRAG